MKRFTKLRSAVVLGLAAATLLVSVDSAVAQPAPKRPCSGAGSSQQCPAPQPPPKRRCGGASSSACQPTPPPPPPSGGTCGAGSSNCQQGGSAQPTTPNVYGNVIYTYQPPGNMQRALNYWIRNGWPDYNHGYDHYWLTVASTVDPATHLPARDIVYTGGRYYDGNGALRAFLAAGGAGPAGANWHGEFQEYNTTIYHQAQGGARPYRDADRLVRAIGLGALFWTTNHYNKFYYAGYR